MHKGVTRTLFAFALVLMLVLTACQSTPPAAPTQPPAAGNASTPTAGAAKTPAAPAANTPAAAPTQAASTGGSGGTLIVGRAGDSVKLDPHDITDGESNQVTLEVFNTLVRYSDKQPPLVIEPSLAEKWTISEDNKTITFNLRKGVKFHDGTAFNADAVIFSFDRMSNPKNEFHKGTFEYYKENFGDFPGNLKSIEKVDDYTVKMTLNDPDGVILPKLSLFTFAIISPTAFKKDPDGFARNPVGTGPFKFVEWVKGDHITLEKNADYWEKGEPKLDKIIFRVIPDNSARAAEMKAGTIHTGEFALSDIPTLSKDSNIQIINQPPLSTGYLAFNFAVKPFDNVKVRQAIAHAINRKAIVDAFYEGMGVVPTQFQPETILGYDPSLKYYEYDPNKAKQLLAEAGFPNGFETDFWYMSVTRGYFPDSKGIAEAMAADLAKVGIKTNLKTEDWAAYLKDREEGKFGMWMLGWGSDNGDPDNFIGYHFVSLNKKEDSYNNQQLHDLLVKGAQVADPKEREKYYKQAEKIVNDDVPRIPVAHAKTPIVLSKKIQGYNAQVFTEGPWRKVWIAQ